MYSGDSFSTLANNGDPDAAFHHGLTLFAEAYDLQRKQENFLWKL